MSYLSITNVKLISEISEEEFEGDALEVKIDSIREELTSLLNSQGEMIKNVEEWKLRGVHTHNFDLSQYPPGIYFIKLEQSNNPFLNQEMTKTETNVRYN